MHIQRPDPAVPLIRFTDVLGPAQHQELLLAVEETHWQLHQPYPRRIFTQPQHSGYLTEIFQPLIDQAAESAALSGEVQQIFLSWELPGCRFMYHRAHPNIGAVMTYDLDDFGGIELEVLTQGFDDTEDYLTLGAQGRAGHRQDFRADSALMVINSEPRHHWGFTADIGPGRVRRGLWIYLGK